MYNKFKIIASGVFVLDSDHRMVPVPVDSIVRLMHVDRRSNLWLKFNQAEQVDDSLPCTFPPADAAADAATAAADVVADCPSPAPPPEDGAMGAAPGLVSIRKLVSKNQP